MEAMTTLPDFQVPEDRGRGCRGEQAAPSRSSPSTRASATRSATASAACCSRHSAAPRSPASASRASPTSSPPSRASRRTSPTSILNLKDVVVRMHTDADEVETPLVATGPGEVKAKDIDLPAGVEILNPEAPIATLEKKTKLEMYLTIGRGRGYSPADENKSDDKPIGVIPIDSIFSPIRRASYSVGLRPSRAADRLRQAHARGRDRRLDRAGCRTARGRGDPDQEPGDLHRPPTASTSCRGEGAIAATDGGQRRRGRGSPGARRARRDPDRGAGAGRRAPTTASSAPASRPSASWCGSRSRSSTRSRTSVASRSRRSRRPCAHAASRCGRTREPESRPERPR
mgnify:CR=1 FL=1